MFIFGVVGMLAAAGDMRMIRAGALKGPVVSQGTCGAMCFAMWVCAASFFFGPPGRVPEAIRIPALLPIPVVVPVVVHVVLAVAYPGQKNSFGIVSVGHTSGQWATK